MRIVLLDLEGTVMDTWFKPDAIPEHLERIAAFLRPDDKLGLMSWAVWDDADRQKFQERFQLGIEEAIKHSFQQDLIFTMMDFSDIILKRRMKWVSKEDMFDLFGKEECLLQLLRLGHFPDNSEVILIDDVVDHDMTFTKGNRSVRFINVGVHEW